MATISQRSAAKAQKARRQKIIAAVLGGVLLIAVVIQGPRTLKMLHGSSQSAPATSSTSSAANTPASSTPIPSTGTQLPGAGSAASVTSLQDSDLPPQRKRSQLLSFETFDSKDPFAQQVSEDQTSPGAPTTSSGSSAAAGPAGVTRTVVNIPAGDTGGSTTPTSSSPSGTSSSTSTRSTAQSGSRATAAVVDVNGKPESVGVAQAFPKANPTFKLISLSNGVAKIGLAGGTYASGAQAVALRLGHTLTLVNTSDGMRYELRLVSAQ